jgi:tetratricopeptide (TPR) repeat protein
MKRSVFQSTIFFLLINLALTFVVLGQTNRLSLSTRNFDLAGEVSENELKSVALKLETFQQAFRQIFPKINIETPFATKVIVFRDESALNFSKISNQDFLPANDANYTVLAINDPQSFEDFYQNYAKFLLENNVGRNNLPAWLFEGLAEYFQTLKIREGQISEFAISLKNVNTLQTNRQIPIDVLLETDHFTLRNQAEDRRQIFRAAAWAWLRYLLKDEPDLAKVGKFIALKKQGIEDKQALWEAFQINPGKIKEEFPKFLEANNFTVQPIQIPEKISVEIFPQTVQISESKWLAIEADFLYYAGRYKESETLIEKSLKLDPNQSLALTTSSLIKAAGFYYDEAEQLAEKAIENEPDNFLNHYRFALALGKRGMTEFGFVSGYNTGLANQMREEGKLSIALNPNFIPSYALLAFVNAVRNEALDESIVLINEALKIAPGNQQYQIRLAELNLRKEKFSEARKLALDVIQTTESNGVKLYAQNTIQRIDATEFQLEQIRTKNAKFENNEIVTEKPLSDDEIKRLREKATNEQIRAILKRPTLDEKRIFGSLAKIECGNNRVDFLFKTQTGLLKFHSNSLDGVRLLSLVEEMSDYRLNCGGLIRENNASIIFKNAGEIISIEFIPKGFK